MNFDDFVTDMALDSLERSSMRKLSRVKRLADGIVKQTVDITDDETAAKVGRVRGRYVTFDCPPSAQENIKTIRSLQKHIAAEIKNLSATAADGCVLVAGLGNDEVTADALGCRVAKSVASHPVTEVETKEDRRKIVSFPAGVEGITGIASADMISAVVGKIKPALVVAVDTLATSSAERLGASYQLTDTGIAPGSGVSRDRRKVDADLLGIPVVAVGVPLVLSMRTVLHDFSNVYSEASGCKGDEIRLRELIVEKKLSNLIVAPKEIRLYVEFSSNVIAGAIQLAFSN